MPLEPYELNALCVALGFIVSGIIIWGWIILYCWHTKRYGGYK